MGGESIGRPLGRVTLLIATVALTAALLHTINHAAFKGLLFLGAGSVICRTHVRNMEELGGLARRMSHGDTAQVGMTLACYASKTFANNN